MVEVQYVTSKVKNAARRLTMNRYLAKLATTFANFVFQEFGYMASFANHNKCKHETTYCVNTEK